MKFLLSVIAVCLVLITGKLFIPELNAQEKSYEFKKAVAEVVEEYCTISYYNKQEVWDETITIKLSEEEIVCNGYY